MRVQGSVAATLASRIYLAVLGLVMLPVYLQQIGVEAFGLVGLFLVLQVWFQLLDAGLTQTLSREAARHRAGALSATNLRLLLRALEGLFLVVAALGFTVMYLGAEEIAHRWLRHEQLSPLVVERSVQLMAMCMAVRLLGELYRGAIVGFEQLRWLAGFSAAFGTLRLALVVPFLAWAGSTPTRFFEFQLAVLALEALALMVKTYQLLPGSGLTRTPWRLDPIRGVLVFSTVMSLASIVWVTLSQIDKLMLSGLLSLADYGAFSLAVSAAAGVLLLTGAISDTVVPRLTHLHAQAARTEMLDLYRHATQGVGIVAWSVACVMAFHAQTVLWVWTGDATLATQAAPILGLYALGNAALAIGAFPFYLQFAAGRLRLHLLGTALMVLVLLPSLVWATASHGAPGAAAVWLGVNLLYLLLWAPVAHARVMPGLHASWLVRDVLPVAALAAIAAALCSWLPWPQNRGAAAVTLIGTTSLVLAASAGGSSWVRARLRRARGPASALR